MNRIALVVCLVVCPAPAVHAQKKPTSALCTQNNAVFTTKQQLLDTRTFDNSVQRIAVLLRGADLLWPHEQETAMAAFMEAFDLAVQDFKDVSDQIARVPKNQLTNLTSLPDQRFKVISALEKRDPVKAKTLSEKILQPETTFREMSKLDFDGSLTQATSLNDKNLRALTTLSVVKPCFAKKSITTVIAIPFMRSH